MNNKKYRFLLLVLSVALLASCGQPAQPAATTTAATTAAIAETTTAAPETTTEPAALVDVPEGAQYSDFRSGMPEGFEASDGWCNGSMFNVTWRKSNVTFDDGKMQLVIDKDSKPKGGIPYSGGEFRSKDFYGYGRYEISMKAIKNDGVVSSALHTYIVASSPASPSL